MIENSRVDFVSNNLHREAKAMFECLYGDMVAASNYSKMELTNVETSIKTVESIKSKLNNIGMNFDDILRFTMVVDNVNYYESVKNLACYLNKNGFYFKRIRNAWLEKRNTYVGLNLDIQFGSYVFEIQIHTPESLEFRNGEDHVRYKQISNDCNLSFLEIQKLQLKSFEESSNIKVPACVEKLNILKIRECKNEE